MKTETSIRTYYQLQGLSTGNVASTIGKIAKQMIFFPVAGLAELVQYNQSI